MKSLTFHPMCARCGAYESQHANDGGKTKQANICVQFIPPHGSKRPKDRAHGRKVKRDISVAEELRPWFLALCEKHGVPTPVWEWRFAAPERQFAFDYAWPESRVALEMQGGIFVNGGHNRGPQYASDMQKFNMAAERGWFVLQCVPGYKDAIGHRPLKNGGESETFHVPGLVTLTCIELLQRVLAVRAGGVITPVHGAQQRSLF